MKRVTLLVIIAVMLSSCGQTGQSERAVSQEDEKDKILTATVEEMLAEPAVYDGKEVAISGMVTHVCRHGGQKCFVVGKDGESQLRIVPSGDIDEFKIELEGSTVAFKGTFKVLNPVQAEEHVADHDSKEHHDSEMAHTQAEKADYFIEATDFKEVTQ